PIGPCVCGVQQSKLAGAVNPELREGLCNNGGIHLFTQIENVHERHERFRIPAGCPSLQLFVHCRSAHPTEHKCVYVLREACLECGRGVLSARKIVLKLSSECVVSEKAGGFFHEWNCHACESGPFCHKS